MKFQIKNIKKASARIISAALAGLMAFGLLIMCPAVPSVRAESASIQQMQDEIKGLEQKQKELLGKINSLSDEEKKTEEYRQSLGYLLDTVTDKITTANALIDDLKRSIEETEKAIEELNVKIAETTEKIKERMRANHEAGAENYFSILIGAEDIGDFLSRVERVNSMMEYDTKLQEQFEAEKTALEEKKVDLEASKALNEKTLEALEKDKAESERLAADAEKYINSLKSDISQYESQYKQAKAAEAALDSQIEAILLERQKEQEKLQQQQQGGSNNNQQTTASGAFMWPLPTGQGYISCYYGGRDPNGAPHYAVDIAGFYSGLPPIYAANDGYVLTASYHYSYGYYVLIDHGNGIATLYAHCSRLTVSAGQTVTKGTTIGYVGTTGFSTGNHLHFEFRVNGKKVNALNYMTAGCK
ncbi:MAG: hypothetical protein E7647_05190 [Ruminococcaceae bacterium]|nr:hypothetical protein [Oscillospiraceae bacterium]